MSQHLHSTYVEGCFRCELSRDEQDPPQGEPSPYVEIYITRRQAEAIREALQGRAALKRETEAALRAVERALDR